MAIERYRRKVYMTDLIEELIGMERRLRASPEIGPLITYVEERQLLGHEVMVNTPPAKAGGFGLRLKAGLIGTSADSCRYTTSKSSSGSGGC